MPARLGGSVAGFAARPLLLGIGEGGNFPAAIKTDSRVVPAQGARLRDRHLQRRARNIGALLTPLLVPWIATDLGLARGLLRHRR